MMYRLGPRVANAVLALSIIALAIGLGIPVPARASALSFGIVVQDSIGAAGEEDVFTFSANAGDIILTRMSVSSGALDPSIQIKDVGGNTICSDYDYHSTAEILSCTIPATATYTLHATDHKLANTGNYALYIQRLNEPGNTTSTDFGTTQSGSLTTTGLFNTYTVAGEAGDHLVLHAVATSGDVRPRVRVYDPDGNLRCQNSSTYSPALLDNCGLLTDGPHTILIGDAFGTHVGVYNFHIQRLNAPGGGVLLEDGQVHSGTVTTVAEMDAYTFQEDVGDVLVVRAAPMSAGGLDPQLRIYDPNGIRICTKYNHDRIVDLSGCMVATEGVHTLLIGDYGGSDVGNYDLTLVKINTPTTAESLAFGETAVRTTDKPAQLHMWTFEGKNGEVVAGRVGVPDGSFDPMLRIYGQNGTLLCRDYAYTESRRDAAYVHCILPADQTYVALVGSYAYAPRLASGTYHLQLQRLTSPVDAVPLYFGIPKAATITLAGEWDTYSFRAQSGDVVTVRMAAAKGTIDPQIVLYGTDGMQLGAAYNYSTYGDTRAEITGVTLPVSGTYTLLAGSYGASDVGDYSLSLICAGPTCGFPLQLNETVYLPLALH